MGRLSRYILFQLVVGMILVTAGLTCVIWLTQSLRFIDWIVNRGLTAGMFVYLTMLLLPSYLTVILPIALFAIVVFTYSRLITDRELVAMRASGVGQMGLAKPALILGLFVTVLSYAINVYFLPESYRLFRDLQWEFRNRFSHVLLQEGTFNVIEKNFTVYVRERAKDGQLLGILVHDARDPEKPSTLMAARGALVRTEEGSSRVVLINGSRQELDKKKNGFTIVYFDRYTVDLPHSGENGDPRHREVEERAIAELLSPETDKDLNPNDFGRYRTEGHRRILSPLYSFGFALIGLATILSGSFTRRSQPHRVTLAVILLIIAQAIELGLRNLCAKNPELIPLMYVNAFVPIILGSIFLIRGPRLHAGSHTDATDTADAGRGV